MCLLSYIWLWSLCGAVDRFFSLDILKRKAGEEKMKRIKLIVAYDGTGITAAGRYSRMDFTIEEVLNRSCQRFSKKISV